MGLLNLHSAVILFVVAIVAGAINSVAGGGSFVTFPTLVFTGVPPIQANATNTLALVPGTLASIGAYRREYSKGGARTLVPLAVTGLLGAVIGALVLLKTPQHTFLRLIPYLLSASTLMFMFSGRITRWVRERKATVGERSWWGWTWTIAVELCIAIYIGYFGAGAGILTLALLALLGIESIHTMNAYKTMLVAGGNAIATVIFIVAGKIYWAQAGVMLVGAIIGGYFGGYFAQKMNPQHVRHLVIVIGWAMAVYFFQKYGF